MNKNTKQFGNDYEFFNYEEFVNKFFKESKLENEPTEIKNELRDEIIIGLNNRIIDLCVKVLNDSEIELITETLGKHPEFDLIDVLSEITSKIDDFDQLLVKLINDYYAELLENMMLIDQNIIKKE